MGKKRLIDPAVWTSGDFTSLSVHARMLYFGCISHADDDGRLTGAARDLKNRVFPADGSLSLSDVETWRSELHGAGLIQHYAVAGKSYIQVAGWDAQQKVRWYQESKLPAPSEVSAEAQNKVSERATDSQSDCQSDPQSDCKYLRDTTSTEQVVTPASPKRDATELLARWNQLAADLSLPQVRGELSDRRKGLAAQRVRDGVLEQWPAICDALRSSPFYLGAGPSRGGGKPWRADFDWLCTVDGWRKLLERAEVGPVKAATAPPGQDTEWWDRVR